MKYEMIETLSQFPPDLVEMCRIINHGWTVVGMLHDPKLDRYRVYYSRPRPKSNKRRKK